MRKTHPLPPQKLRALPADAAISFDSSADIPPMEHYPPQPRALQALELAVNIPSLEHNVYVSGMPGMGRTYFVEKFLTPRAKEAHTPDDWIYVFNFEEPENPRAISLPPGMGRRFQTELKKAVQSIRKAIPQKFEQDVYIKKREKLFRSYSEVRDGLMDDMEDKAFSQGFKLKIDDEGAMIFQPMVEGQAISPDEFDRLPPAARKDIKVKGNKLLDVISEGMRQIEKEENKLEENRRTLDEQIVTTVLKEFLSPLETRFSENADVVSYLNKLKNDIIENIEEFDTEERDGPLDPREMFLQGEDFFDRYQVNLFVDNGKREGAPVVIEDNPTFFNLLGSIQRETEWGTLYTDFTLLKAGSMHKANGGYLIIHAEQLLENPAAWEGLLRCLRTGKIRVEDPTHVFEQIQIKTLEPDSIPLKTRIILVGTEEIYELLLYHEERFSKYFKLKAHLQEWMDRTKENILIFLGILTSIIQDELLLPFRKSTLAALVDYSSRLAQDQEKLSLFIPHIRDIMIEAHVLAKKEGKSHISAAYLNSAIGNQAYRSNLYEEEFHHEYNREAIKVPTRGKAVGRTIGLSVSQYGDYLLALPHLISCTIGVGHGGVLDLEREAELGGPIHTKGMMIIKSYLLELFAQDKLLTFTGSLCFEQSYAEVEGDSASGAELAALLSALARIPVNLSLAFTGAVSQSGAILAVGEVNKKIEGFFNICRQRGFTGNQGVIIPADNQVHLMLKDEVIAAVEDGNFHIYPVKTIEEAMEVLTDIPAGRRLKSGSFSKNSLYKAVDDRLLELAYLAEKEIKKKKFT